MAEKEYNYNYYKSPWQPVNPPLRKLSELKQGERFKLGEMSVIKLDDVYGGCLCLSASSLFESAFDDNGKNNWAIASLRKKIKDKVFEFLPDDLRLIPFERDLTLRNGKKIYGTCIDTISLLSEAEYQKYQRFIPIDRGFLMLTALFEAFPYLVSAVNKRGLVAFYPDDKYTEIRALFVADSETIIKNKT